MLGYRTVVGSTWMVGARIASRIVDLATMLVLARILEPRDFGLVAIAMTLIYIVEAALELPVSQALVRLASVSASQYNTAFTLSMLRGIALALTICTIALPFARFYSDVRLFPLVCVLSLAPIARGLVSPKLAEFSRALKFSPDFIMELSGKSIAFIVAIGLGFIMRSYWAIAAGTVVAPLVGSAASYIFAPYRPKLSLSALPSFSGFLGWITAAQVVSALNWQTDRLLLGKLTSKSALGLFSAANDASNIPIAALFSPILRPLLSAFSLLRLDSSRLARSYQASAISIVTVGMPVLLLESTLAYPAIRLIFGEHWLGAVPLLRWLAISLIPGLFALPLGPLAMAFDETKVFFKRNAVEISVKLPLVVFGAIKYGFMGVIVARCISEVVTVFYSMHVIRRLVGLSLCEQLLGPWRSIVSSGVLVATILTFEPLVSRSGNMASLFVITVFVALVGAASYVLTLWTLWFATGKPSGIEKIIAERLSGIWSRGRHFVAPEML